MELLRWEIPVMYRLDGDNLNVNFKKIIVLVCACVILYFTSGGDLEWLENLLISMQTEKFLEILQVLIELSIYQDPVLSAVVLDYKGDLI